MKSILICNCIVHDYFYRSYELRMIGCIQRWSEIDDLIGTEANQSLGSFPFIEPVCTQFYLIHIILDSIVKKVFPTLTAYPSVTCKLVATLTFSYMCESVCSINVRFLVFFG